MLIVVAMSGGVDSSTAAALLVEQGHRVIGVTFRIADPGSAIGESTCCSEAAIGLARDVAARLGIEHRLVERAAVFEREVLRPFVAAYLAGLTPSPCARCNSRLKFRDLAELADDLGADAIATGHYARHEIIENRPALLRARDRRRDQSYFLFEVPRERLARAVFPLGGLSKDEVRARAREVGLPNAEREDSQDVCFAASGTSYLAVVARLAGDRLPGPGEVVDTAGRVLGQHDGVHRFTVGQRRGLGVAGHQARYVVEIQPGQRRVVVGSLAEAERRRLELAECNWLVDVGGTSRRALVQVRSRHDAAAAVLSTGTGGTATVEFDEPVLAPAPGQAAVAYDGDRVLGGGWIVRTE
jgi:tRNA-specific 2-thiouridylase